MLAAVTYLDFAKRRLTEALTMLDVGFTEAAGRNTDLSRYFAAQSFITALTGKPAKSYRAVTLEFWKLTKDRVRAAEEFKAFLYNAASPEPIVEHPIGEVELTKEEIVEGIEIANRLINFVEEYQQKSH